MKKQKLAKVICFGNQKGGVGKTTTTHSVSAGLVKRGYKVLACDLDPQSNLSAVLGVNVDDDDLVSIKELFDGDCEIRDAIVKTESGVDLLVGNLLMSGADRKYSSTGDEYKIKEALQDVKNDYDYIVLDTPPALGIMSLNALAATDYLVVVMTPDFFSGKGLKQFQETVNTVKKYLSNPDLKINGILLTKCDTTNLSSIVNDDMKDVAKTLNTKIFKTKIRHAVAVRESQYLESSLYDIKSTNVRQDFDDFIDELLKEVKKS